MITIEWPVTEAEKKPKGDAPLSKDDKKFIKQHTTKKDDDKKSDGGGDFNAKHPRAEAGSAAGGEFVPASSGGNDKDDKGGKGGKGGKEKSRGRLTDAGKKDGGPGLAFKAGYGQKGGDKRVKGLQSTLNKLGLTDAAGKSLAVDGMLGPKTTAAIKKAQKRLGMKPTGKADGAFLSKLKAGNKGKLTRASSDVKKPPVRRGPVGKLEKMNVSKPGARRPASKTDKRPLAGSVSQGTRKGATYE